MGLTNTLQCNYNVKINQNLSNQIIKTNDNSLLNLKRYLKKYDLLNNKNLTKRKEIYYFTFYLEKEKNICISLNTKDFFLSNILKYKILLKLEEKLKKMGLEEDYLKQFNTNLTIHKTKKGFIVEKDENDEDENFVNKSVNKIVNSIVKNKINVSDTNIQIKTRRKTKNDIRKIFDFYITSLKKENDNKKTVESYIKKFEFLLDYLYYKKILDIYDINNKVVEDFENILRNLPSNHNKHKELIGKNIFELIENEDKILNKFEKIEKRTFDNYITRYKTLFTYLKNKKYVNENYFMFIKKLSKKGNNNHKNFILRKDTYMSFEIEEIETILKNIEDEQIKKIIIISLSSGLRSGEILNLKKEDIVKYKNNFLIDVKKSKTESGIRLVPINSFFNFFYEDLIKDVKENEFLFFKEQIENNRNDNLQKKIMRHIRKINKNENKVFHSFRKNYTQLLYKNDIEELYIKLFLGHSLEDNLSFNTYNLSKIDNNLMLKIINRVNFEEVFENIPFYNEKREVKKDLEQKIKILGENNISL